MKLEKYEDKSKKKRKIVLISISLIVLISVSFLLYKTFASFTESSEFPMMNGKVDYFGNSDVYFAFYQGDKELEEMPEKDNKENLIFEHGECDNGASILWNESEWAPLVKGLNKVKTKCSLYFIEQKYIKFGGVDIPIVLNGDGLYEIEHNVSEISTDWNQTEYRYAGNNPNNYVRFNNEIWRIIGLVNVKTENGIEQRIKIVRQDGIEGQKDFGNYAWDKESNNSNNWTTSKLKDMLNGIYYESSIGECYIGQNGSASTKSNCDFSAGTDLPKGLNIESQNMIDKNIIFNIGGVNTYPSNTSRELYEKERWLSTGNDNNNPSEWNITTNVGENYNGIALIYASDYGFATSGGTIGRNKCFEKKLQDWYYEVNYQNECLGTDWLKPNKFLWTLTSALGINIVMIVNVDGNFYDSPTFFSNIIWPTLYLKPSVKITDNPQSNKDYGTIDNPFILSLD